MVNYDQFEKKVNNFIKTKDFHKEFLEKLPFLEYKDIVVSYKKGNDMYFLSKDDMFPGGFNIVYMNLENKEPINVEIYGEQTIIGEEQASIDLIEYLSSL